MFRTFEVAQPHHPEIAKRHFVGRALAHQIDNSLGQQHLSAVSGVHDSCRSIDRIAEVVVVTALDHAEVHAASRVHLHAGRPAQLVERALKLDRRTDRVERVRENGMHAVAYHLHDDAAVVIHHGPCDRVVARQRHPHFVRRALPKPAAALDVGKENSRNCGTVIHPKNLRRHRARLLYGTGAASTSAPRLYRRRRDVRSPQPTVV